MRDASRAKNTIVTQQRAHTVTTGGQPGARVPTSCGSLIGFARCNYRNLRRILNGGFLRGILQNRAWQQRYYYGERSASAPSRYMQLTLPLIWGENATISVNSAIAASSKAPAGLYVPSPEAPHPAGGAAITMAGDNSSESHAISTKPAALLTAHDAFVIDGDIFRAAGATAASGTLPQQNSTD